MSVRGSKNKIIIYIAGACSIAFAILLYRDASQRLEAMEISYERCHLNEESLSAQLQVNLEYKIRLEKSLQQEKSDHAQTKEDLQKKADEERQLKIQLEALHGDYEKSRQLQLSEEKDKKHLEEVVENLKKEVHLLRENNERDLDQWKAKYSSLETGNSLLRDENRKLQEKIEAYEKLKELMKTSPSQEKLPNNLPANSLSKKGDGSENQLRLPNFPKEGVSPSMVKSSTAANKMDRDMFPSANSLFANISTPMINPQAVQGDDKIPIAPMPQPRQESSSMKDPNMYDVKENVGPKPDELPRDNLNGVAPIQGVLRAPDIFHHFAHVPEIQNYRKQLKESERNNHGGEVGDEDEAIAKNVVQNPMNHWREDEFREQHMAANPMGNEIPRNQGYQYPVEDEVRKEEGEDDDDMDPAEYQNANEKNNDRKENNLKPMIQIPFGMKHDSVMLQPK